MKGKKLKQSQKRNRILDLFRNGDILTAQQILKILSDIDRATIYRNLNLLVEQGILRQLNIDSERTYYEINDNNINHQHFLCLKCGIIEHVNLDGSQL